MSEFHSRIHPGDTDGAGWAENSKFEIRNSKSTEAGYTLVVLVMAVAVMAILLVPALQLIEFQARREREAELIFRGKQYVEAIRLYKQKYGRHPMRMKELWEANPRVLRQKWTDPITGSAEWGLIFLGQEGSEVGARGRQQRAGAKPTPTPTPVFSREREGGGEKVGPIIGVHSLSTDQSIKIYEGRTTYNEWRFILEPEERQRGGRQGGGTGGRGRPTGQTPGMPTPALPEPTGTPRY